MNQYGRLVSYQSSILLQFEPIAKSISSEPCHLALQVIWGGFGLCGHDPSWYNFNVTRR
jgi:hypothetical protein